MEAVEQIRWKTNIKTWGYELGFVSVGFTTADPINGLAQLLKARMDQGVAAPFEDKEIEQRIDPQANWQSCLTVVALAYPLPSTLPSKEGEGVIARSAVGEDYHRVLQQKINVLVQTMVIEGWPGTFRWQVDTGPLVERAFAVRAGLGWIGRNQHLIIPGYGSFVALALLLLDQEIEPDHPPMLDQCGACQRCAEACPAQIIGQEPFAAKHCVSYLTQSKEVLTQVECGLLGMRIFGCDTCQEVCPHNQKRIHDEQKALSSFAPSSSVFPLRRGVDLLDTLNLSKGEFQQHFKTTAAGWRGKGVLQRNAFLVMRNIKDSRYKLWLAEREKDKLVPPIIAPYLQQLTR
ncbi:tRNA epoxyqueuosine(34) reductase QueG [Desulfosporosinus metallidurans]|uniref:Epoxyqueuosine (OQ) reductase QueG n=1 Tax=Desulfosporosinus metallidurans TaxID=1888891 RepID=A0A1Q8R0F5_9FIRM|nr:tRNA epoxyqueuosine(34) reductase QueG [Desulfosporosinus metallidurans]OLN32870.1 Epoxyqueuosine (oQ) reductase QueG [Desulfosporosinus metallidurans]